MHRALRQCRGPELKDPFKLSKGPVLAHGTSMACGSSHEWGMAPSVGCREPGRGRDAQTHWALPSSNLSKLTHEFIKLIHEFIEPNHEFNEPILNSSNES